MCAHSFTRSLTLKISKPKSSLFIRLMCSMTQNKLDYLLWSLQAKPGFGVQCWQTTSFVEKLEEIGAWSNLQGQCDLAPTIPIYSIALIVQIQIKEPQLKQEHWEFSCEVVTYREKKSNSLCTRAITVKKDTDMNEICSWFCLTDCKGQFLRT